MSAGQGVLDLLGTGEARSAKDQDVERTARTRDGWRRSRVPGARDRRGACCGPWPCAERKGAPRQGRPLEKAAATRHDVRDLLKEPSESSEACTKKMSRCGAGRKRSEVRSGLHALEQDDS